MKMGIGKKIFLFFVVISIPVVLFFSTWQNFRYRILYSEVRELERVQEEWIEENKSLIVGIEIFKSPKRIDKIAVNELGLHRATASEVLKIVRRREIR